MDMSLIVPCYNEQEAIPIFYRETTAVMEKMAVDYEILFVNDGSKDNTLHVMKELAAQDPHVVYLSLSRNFGKEAAMYAGFCNAGGGICSCYGCGYAGSSVTLTGNDGDSCFR